MPDILLLLLQVCVILGVARLVGWLFKKMHQPQVVGEMVAGILLGPSLLGLVAPRLSAALFPPDSLGYLSALSQIGLVLFMFLVGLELEGKLLRNQGEVALFTSHASIAVPFFLGTVLALLLYPRFSNDSVSFLQFALFLGTAMSITAFPVLARILTERKMLRTRLGAVAIACAAVDDVTGWIILAGIVLLIRAGEGITPAWVIIGGLIVYLLVMFFGVRRLLRRLEDTFEKKGGLTQDSLAIILLLVLGSSIFTELLGIHALFGAFLMGAIMPKHPGFVHALTEKLNDIAVVLLLPLFFAFNGLRTSIGLVSGAANWLFTFLIIAVAIAGKFGGSTLAARLSGMGWREASSLGILMNTRGLMELVLLNIGLDIGVISPALFTMMVLMALATTFMTSPLLEWIYFSRVVPKEYEPELEAAQEEATTFSIVE
jgi:Kef-type K+ transport system membrane component KefB